MASLASEIRRPAAFLSGSDAGAIPGAQATGSIIVITADISRLRLAAHLLELLGPDLGAYTLVTTEPVAAMARSNNALREHVLVVAQDTLARLVETRPGVVAVVELRSPFATDDGPTALAQSASARRIWYTQRVAVAAAALLDVAVPAAV